MIGLEAGSFAVGHTQARESAKHFRTRQCLKKIRSLSIDRLLQGHRCDLVNH